MCRLQKLPDRLYIASFFLTREGYLVTVRTRGKFDNRLDYIGSPKQIRNIVLWKNAKSGKLGVNYKIWPWHKKLMAHLRLNVCRLKEKSFSPEQICEN